MPLQDSVNLLLEVFELLSGPLCHILNILLLVQGDFQCSTVGIHALQDLPVLHACLEKGRIQWKANTLFHSFMLDKGIYAAFLELGKTTCVRKIVGARGINA